MPPSADPTEDPAAAAPTRLARRLGTWDAVMVGLGAMIGAGVFSAFGPAALVAGNALMVALLIAGAVAFCNATSTAQLAALYPESGGAYVYGRERLGPLLGFVAGWGFVIGKLASCAAMAITFGSYAAPGHERVAAAAAIAALTALNLRGVQKTAALTRVIVAFVLVALALVVAASFGGGAARVGRLWPLNPVSPRAALEAAGLLFFAFAGYARLATLGEEVIDPARTIPRAIPLSLGIALVVYLLVGAAALAALGAEGLARASAPLAAAVGSGRFAALAPLVRVGAAVASLGVLLSLIAGISRTSFAMAAAGDLPRVLAAVHPRHRVPHRAELLVGAVVMALALTIDLRGAIGFSSFAVLGYYAVANAAALTLAPAERRFPRALAGGGLAGCLLLATSLPAQAVITGGALFAAGAIVHLVRRRASA